MSCTAFNLLQKKKLWPDGSLIFRLNCRSSDKWEETALPFLLIIQTGPLLETFCRSQLVFPVNCKLFCAADMSPAVLAELVMRICSTRLRMVVADAIFRNICCSNGLTVADDALSLKKMVSLPFYLLHSLVNQERRKSKISIIFVLKLWYFRYFFGTMTSRVIVESVIWVFVLPNNDILCYFNVDWLFYPVCIWPLTVAVLSAGPQQVGPVSSCQEWT